MTDWFSSDIKENWLNEKTKCLRERKCLSKPQNEERSTPRAEEDEPTDGML